MTKKNRSLKIALAGATAMFVSMPPSTSAQEAISATKLRNKRSSRLGVGPMSIRANKPYWVSASVWRPRTGVECGAEVRIRILNLEEGTVLDERIETTGDGDAVVVKTEVGGEVNEGVHLIGARADVRPSEDQEAQLRACKMPIQFSLTLETADEQGNKSSIFDKVPISKFDGGNLKSKITDGN